MKKLERREFMKLCCAAVTIPVSLIDPIDGFTHKYLEELRSFPINTHDDHLLPEHYIKISIAHTKEDAMKKKISMSHTGLKGEIRNARVVNNWLIYDTVIAKDKT